MWRPVPGYANRKMLSARRDGRHWLLRLLPWVGCVFASPSGPSTAKYWPPKTSYRFALRAHVRGGFAMSDSLVALLITLAILASMLIWVPLLELICPPCSRFLVRLKQRR